MDESLVAVATNNLLLIFSIIIITGIALGKVSEMLKIPDVILYLIAGIIIGPAFLDLVSIQAYPVENNLILTFGSAFILFEGGKEINLKILNKVKVSVTMLSTVGVVVSAAVVAFFAAKVFDIPLVTAFLLGAVLASTDPAALIPIFKQVKVKDKIKQTVVSESAFNDAAGAILSATVLAVIVSGDFSLKGSIVDLLVSASVGIIVGLSIGYLLIMLVSNKRMGVFASYAPIMSILTVILAYEVSIMLNGSGYMAVFMAGLITGNKKIFGIWLDEKHYNPTVHVSENIATICRMSIFVLLGTHVNLDSLAEYWLPSLLTVLALMFIARP
ncbi:MAG: cation:proton antiporter, partial [Anaerovoracaceae bacterium]